MKLSLNVVQISINTSKIVESVTWKFTISFYLIAKYYYCFVCVCVSEWASEGVWDCWGMGAKNKCRILAGEPEGQQPLV